MSIIYSTSVNVVGGRDGRARSSDGRLEVQLSTPKELGGSGTGSGTNPEQLFAAGYAACFESGVRHVAKQQGKTLRQATVDADVGIGPNREGGFELSVALHVITEGLTTADAEMIIRRVHNVMCPYSNALRGNVDVKVSIDAQP